MLPLMSLFSIKTSGQAGDTWFCLSRAPFQLTPWQTGVSWSYSDCNDHPTYNRRIYN